MAKERRIVFGPFYLDLANERLWRGSEAIPLRPKAFGLLRYFVERPGRLVTKQELLDAIWPETFVGDAVLKVTIRQLRSTLEDDPKTPRYIETAHRRGYRFIGQIEEGGDEPAVEQEPWSDRTATVDSKPLAAYAPVTVVGRNEALTRMQGWLDKALARERQIVFVTGEAGIGKTALVDTFGGSLASAQGIRIARGQCLEQYGTGEAYLPVLEAIGQLCRDHEDVLHLLRAHAPMWLLQMPSVVSASERELLRREVVGATRERMLREMGDALEALASDVPLVIILEDLHLSDYSTLDLISYIARQRRPAQLMLIGTYRIVELIVSGHPLKAVKQELLAKQLCEELPLEYLGEDAVAEYLSAKFPANAFPAALANLIHERTEGNPLFLVNAVDYLVTDGLIVERDDTWELAVALENIELGVPDSIKQLIEKQLDHLEPDDLRTLEAASVAGSEFSTVAVAAGLVEDRSAVDVRCDRLARRRQFIQDCGVHELPDGEAATRFAFIHTLYRSVLYERVSTSRRVHLHRRIAEQAELHYGDRAREISAELAMHFERGGNFAQSAKYFQQAAENAIRRFAYHEAVGLARRGLGLLKRLADTPERAEQELWLHLTLGVPLIATEGYAAPEVGSIYMKARELSQKLGETPEISQVLWGLRTFYTVRAELAKAQEIAEEFLRLADRLPYTGLAMRGHWALEITFMHMGEFSRSIEHFEKALSLYDPEQHRDDAFLYAQVPGVAMRCFAAWALWFLGQPDRAYDCLQEALALARELAEPHGLAPAFFFAAVLHQLRGEVLLAQEFADASIAVSSQHGLVLYQAMATIMRGWALSEQGREEEAIAQIREGLEAHQATGTEVLRPHFLALLAEALGKSGQTEEALLVSDEALDMARRNGEGYYEAELYRIKGELFLLESVPRSVTRAATSGHAVSNAESSAVSRAEGCFDRAVKIAQQQKATSWELRATMSMARLRRLQGRQEEARELLSNIYGQFTEGFDTGDVHEVRALLDELS